MVSPIAKPTDSAFKQFGNSFVDTFDLYPGRYDDMAIAAFNLAGLVKMLPDLWSSIVRNYRNDIAPKVRHDLEFHGKIQPDLRNYRFCVGSFHTVLVGILSISAGIALGVFTANMVRLVEKEF